LLELVRRNRGIRGRDAMRRRSHETDQVKKGM